MTDEALFCHRCGGLIQPGDGQHWQVRIEAVRDPTMNLDAHEPLSSEELDNMFNDLEQMSAKQAMDSIYRRLQVHLCAACFEPWMYHPTG